MIPTHPLLAAAAGAVLFLAPGLTLLALLPRPARARLPADERMFLVVAASVMASAWTGLVLAEAGVFSLPRAAGLLAALCAGALALGRRRVFSPLGDLPRDARGRLARPWIALGLLALCFAAMARPGEYLVGGRDPGIYVATMGLVARTGGIAWTDPTVLSIPPEDVELFYRHPEGNDWSWGRFMGVPLENPRTGRVVPEFFHLFPVFGAYLFQAMGAKGALATPPVFGILGTLAAFFALRRLFGETAAALAALLLAVNVVQVWFARYPVSEPMSQFLLLTGLFAFALWEDHEEPHFGALAGAALGLCLLVRIDGVLLAAPVALWLVMRRATRHLTWRQALPFVLPLGLLGAHAAVHALFWSRKYIAEIAGRPYWQQPTWMWLAGTAAALGVILTIHHLRGAVVPWLERHGALVRRVLAAALVVLALYAYFVRPLLSAWAGADGNDPARALTDPGWLRAWSFHRLAAHDAQALVRLGWFVTPLGLALALAGLVVALREAQPRLLFPLLVFATYGGFYLYKIRVYADYYFALRRYVPVVLPVLLGLAALALVRLAAPGGARRGAAVAAALAVLLSFARDTAPVLAHREWRNAVRFVDDVARRFGPRDVVIFEQPRSIHLLSLPLWAVHGVNAVELARFNPDPERLRHLVRAWRTRYRNIYFVHTYSTDLCGLFLETVSPYSFGTEEWERAYGRKPRGPEAKALRFTLSRVVLPEELQVPHLAQIDVGGADDVVVSGFFDKEGGGERTYRWTGSCASAYLPGLRPGDELAITASAGRRPAERAATVRVSLGGAPLGTFVVSGPGWTEHRVAVPPSGFEGPPVLRLDVPAWRPANTEPASDDVRDLGVMVDRIRVLPFPADTGRRGRER